jgi:hypothetical protein
MKLQLKQGKKPTFAEEDETPPASAVPAADVSDQKPASLSTIGVTKTPSGSNKRKGRDNFDDYPKTEDPKNAAKRRKDPNVELSDIFESIITKLISAPDALDFYDRVPEERAPGYYKLIQRPMWLGRVKEVLDLINLERFKFSIL